MSLPQCQIVVYPYGNESITARMLNGAIDDTRDTNIITRAAVKALQDLDPWLVSPLEDASVELQVRFREGARICPERFTVIETVPAGFPDRCGIAVGQNSSICHDFHQTGYRALPTVFRRLTPEEIEAQRRNQERQQNRAAEYDRERRENIIEEYRRRQASQT